MAPPTTHTAAPNNLPTQLTSFVGRLHELAVLDAMLSSTRLLTLTGSGGCGKTRLSLQLAANAVDRYPDGVWCVELAPLSDPGLIEAALAAAVGVRPLPGRTALEAVISHLAPRRVVVVLDNCEHLLHASAVLATALLRGCPEVTVIATSREPLGVGGETTWRVPSLTLPGQRAEDAEELLRESDAARLFIERAAKVRPGQGISAVESRHVAQICRELDGIPLAIELAAARVRVLSVERIASELSDRFHLLTGGERGVLPRLQTLRASVDWSHDLLDADERTLLRRCGVFHGGFTLDACEAVCMGGDLDRYAMLDLLTSLVDKSLVLVEAGETVTRYRLLETIRQYALARLDEAGESRRLADLHAEAFLALAENTAPILGADIDSDDLLGADAANLHAAIEHTADVEPDKALRLCSALSYWWLLTGRLVEGPAALTRALDATLGETSKLRCGALFWRGYLGFFAGDYDLTQSDGAEALPMAEALGDRVNEARILNMLGLLGTRPDPRGALPTLERSCELAAATGDTWCLAEATQNLGFALLLMGQEVDAIPKAEASYEIARRSGWRDLIAWHWWMLGLMIHHTGDSAAVRALWARSLEGASDVQDGMATWSLSLLDTGAGRGRDALEYLERCRQRMIAGGVGVSLPFLRAGVGAARAALGQLDEAHHDLLAAASEHSHGFVWGQAMALIDLAHTELLRGRLDDAQKWAEAALEVSEHLGHTGLGACARVQMACVAANRSDWPVADQLVHEALADQVQRGDNYFLPDTLDVLAEVASGLQSHEEAARLLGAASRARGELDLVRWQPAQRRIDELILGLREALGADGFAAAHEQGEALRLDEAVAYVRRARGSRRRPSHGWGSLTATEQEIARHTAAGLTNPEIAERMFMARGTVKVHLSHIYAKLGLRNRSEVAAEVIRRRM